MITLSGGFRTSFRNEIQQFCEHNNLNITYRSCLGNFDNYNIGGETTDIEKLIAYNEELETKRKAKSLWYKLWN